MAQMAPVQTDEGGGGIAPEGLGISCLICLGVVLVIAVLSMGVVHPTEYGLTYNRITQLVGEDVKGPGRHIIGPQNYLIIYPSVAQTIRYPDPATPGAPPLQARTDDGLDLKLTISFQFRLQFNNTRKLYLKYRDAWEAVIRRQSSDQILREAGKFSARDYWEQRSAIPVQIQNGLQQIFIEELVITDVQLIQSELPESFENTIVESQVQRQVQQTRQQEQAAAVIRAEIDVMLADYEREKQITLNSATAAANLLTRTAEANAQRARIDVENFAVDLIKQNLNFSSSGVIAYQKGIAYQNLDHSHMLFGIDQTAVLTRPPTSAAASETCSLEAEEEDDKDLATAHVAGMQLKSTMAAPSK